jgi:serine protease
MKRAAAFLFLLALSTAVFAAEPMYPVMVGLKSTGPLSVKSLAATFNPDEPAREFRRFTTVNAFAAKLTASEIEALRKSPAVAYVEEDVTRHAFKLAPKPAASAPFAQITPYGIDLIRARQAWVGGKGVNVNVVVVDTGVDYRHPDLAPIYAGGLNVTVTPATNDPLDDNGHGTHCSGIVAAVDDQNGLVGVAPQIKLWGVKVLNSEGSGSSSNIVRAFDWVTEKKTTLGGNWVVSLSLGSCFSSTTERAAVEKAIAAGILVISASGNHDPTSPDVCEPNNNNAYAVSYPAAYAGVIAVGAVDSAQSVASFSNFGPELTLSAPGVQVLSTYLMGHGDWSVMTPEGGSAILAPPVQGSPTKDASGPYVFCGLGKVGEFPASVSGKIALIKRGDITFKEKTKNAKAAGATAVVIFNRDTSAISWTLIGKVDSSGKVNPTLCDNPETVEQCHDDPADLAFDWPLTVGIPLADGEKLVNDPKASISINYRLDDDYGIESGTSMACPHVAGAAAAIWSMAPAATADAVKQALISTARDLGDPGADSKYGHGLIDVEAAGKLLAPGAFSNGGTPQPSKPSGRLPGRRGH